MQIHKPSTSNTGDAPIEKIVNDLPSPTDSITEEMRERILDAFKRADIKLREQELTQKALDEWNKTQRGMDRHRRSYFNKLVYYLPRNIAFVVINLLAGNGIKNPNYLRDQMKGLSTGSILGNPLYYPESTESLGFSNAGAGLWNVFDPNKPIGILGSNPGENFNQDVRLFMYPIHEVSLKGSEEKTPDDLFDPLDGYHAQTISPFSISLGLAHGLIEEMSYIQAISSMNLEGINYDKCYSEYGLKEKTIIRITPKGNTLIVPFKSIGSKSPPMNLRAGSSNPVRIS